MAITSVEQDASWVARINSDIPANARVIHCSDEGRYADEILKCSGEFEVIIIDGSVRFPCAERAVRKLSADGVIILDNAEWYPNTCIHLRQYGFSQIDFIGLSPINAFTSCTSIFIRNLEMFNNRIPRSNWKPIGGRFLLAHDDIALTAIDPSKLKK